MLVRQNLTSLDAYAVKMYDTKHNSLTQVFQCFKNTTVFRVAKTTGASPVFTVCHKSNIQDSIL